jgi:hypothetical protein
LVVEALLWGEQSGVPGLVVQPVLLDWLREMPGWVIEVVMIPAFGEVDNCTLPAKGLEEENKEAGKPVWTWLAPFSPYYQPSSLKCQTPR